MTDTNNRPVFYLKINKWDGNADSCLRFWLKVIELTNSKYYIVCDSPAAIRWLTKIKQDEHIIPSDREQSEFYIERIGLTDAKWKRVFAAHFTTFLHAKEHGYNKFWNIDADDIIMMIPDEKIKEIFTGIEEYAENNNIDLFSYDMYRSYCNGMHWSYGVTYTREIQKFIDVFAGFDTDKWESVKDKYRGPFLNIDWFTTYLKDINALNIQTFYIEKMYFLHLELPMVGGPFSLMLPHDGMFEYPILKNIYELDHIRISHVPIYKDVIKMDYKLTRKESLKAMINNMMNYEFECKLASEIFPELIH